MHTSSFLIHSSSFLIHNSLFMMHTSSFVIHNSSFLIHNSLFMMHNSSFLIHNSSFLHNSLFMIHNSSFMIQNPSLLKQGGDDLANEWSDLGWKLWRDGGRWAGLAELIRIRWRRWMATETPWTDRCRAEGSVRSAHARRLRWWGAGRLRTENAVGGKNLDFLNWNFWILHLKFGFYTKSFGFVLNILSFAERLAINVAKRARGKNLDLFELFRTFFEMLICFIEMFGFCSENVRFCSENVRLCRQAVASIRVRVCWKTSTWMTMEKWRSESYQSSLACVWINVFPINK